MISERPPLYTPDGAGGWTCNTEHYAPEDRVAWVAQELARCRRYPAYFITRYCYTLNQQLDSTDGSTLVELVPPWPFVLAVISAFFPRRDVLIEKSRDMLVSWLAMAAVLHDLTFRKHWPVMTLSRVEKLVDDGGEASTISSLHGRIRFIWQHLPGFLRPPLEFSHLAIRNPETGAQVMGFAATPNAGRGPKFQRAIGDEFAWVPWSEEVMASMTRACPIGKALISTPHGKANAFARIALTRSRRVYPEVETPEAPKHWEKFTVHWSLHPEHDQAWFDRKVEEGSMTDEGIAQEMEISYTPRTAGNRVYPKFIYERHVIGAPLCTVRELRYSPDRPLYVCCDWNPDPLIWTLVQPYPDMPRFHVIGEICRRHATWDDNLLEFVCMFGSQAVVSELLNTNPGLAKSHGERRLLAGDAGHTAPVVIFGDATEEKSQVYQRTPIYQALRSEMKRYKFDCALRVPPSNPSRDIRFATVNDAFRRNFIVVAPKCIQLIKDFEEGVWNAQQTDIDKSTREEETGLTRSHASDGIGYFLVQAHQLPGRTDAASRQQPRAPTSEFLGKLARRWR